MSVFASLEVGFDDNDNVKRLGKVLMQQDRLIGVGAYAVFDKAFLEILYRNMVVVDLVTVFSACALFILNPLIGKIERGIMAQFGDQVQATLPCHLQGIVVAKMTVQHQVCQAYFSVDERQLLRNHGFDPF